ncbi:MAG: hypothetical protein M3R57_03770, partial [Chloroflexota bacterium]|nr:hypothetical protein [Chloroflexota bacterium]
LRSIPTIGEVAERMLKPSAVGKTVRPEAEADLTAFASARLGLTHQPASDRSKVARRLHSPRSAHLSLGSQTFAQTSALGDFDGALGALAGAIVDQGLLQDVRVRHGRRSGARAGAVVDQGLLQDFRV